MWLESLVVRALNALRKKPRVKPTRGVLLGNQTGASGNDGPVVLPDSLLAQHAVMLGKTGSGKSHAIEFMAWQHMQQGRGLLVLDPHGDSAAHIIELASLHPEAEDRLLIFDPTDPASSPALNPLEVTGGGLREIFSRTSEVCDILRQRWKVDSFGPRTEELLRNTLFTAAAHNLTLADLPLILTSARVRERLVAALPSADIRAYWQDRFEPVSEAQKAQFREPVLNKITSFLSDPYIRHVVGQQRSTVNFTEAMQQGRWVVVNLAKGLLREHAHTLGNLMMSALTFSVLARARIPPRERRMFVVLADEAQNYAENDIETILTEARKFNTSITVASQFWEQQPPRVRAALLTAGTHMFFKLSAADAGTLAPELSSTSRQRYVSELTSLARGHAIVRIGSEPPAVVRIPPLPSLPPDARERVRLLTSRSRDRYTRARAAIDADIAERQRSLAESIEPTINQPANETSNNEGQNDW